MSRWPLVLLALAAPLVPATAQTPDSTIAAPLKQMRAVRLQGGGINVDGRLDEAAWARAEWISDFTQKMPKEGAANGQSADRHPVRQ